ncbi:uncharacterized protein [Aegilops tauschii subsp. strangulata]|uniref:uncharacterized protein n=1 Tax=Aegilops tauschii subsp. strangulata TaxID=200361 RepID=UPI00098ABC3F|nr:uncharacterized protein LOC109762827 [Aegilops tauschii subsp. strangulata]XP_020177293.1 uncharacterized protein LOC109762827 [Aegilops tauschii subsp. strangulata]XP_020177294.1 uncharacterized protein LOC109762827 [Aegilops tauschii subsp. strangulata]XP_020177295.1 uncharacterized protein LOC109762827 [Aegilops tauschii subsp. strangulata]XP_020177296.1 uncharacterized protein LOC109762827 [Aegilops tauschii subsp. strangulata]XP_020177297.1 uncharacterized protein LOC109762827 [Aegilop
MSGRRIHVGEDVSLIVRACRLGFGSRSSGRPNRWPLHSSPPCKVSLRVLVRPSHRLIGEEEASIQQDMVLQANQMIFYNTERWMTMIMAYEHFKYTGVLKCWMQRSIVISIEPLPGLLPS